MINLVIKIQRNINYHPSKLFSPRNMDMYSYTGCFLEIEQKKSIYNVINIKHIYTKQNYNILCLTLKVAGSQTAGQTDFSGTLLEPALKGQLKICYSLESYES